MSTALKLSDNLVNLAKIRAKVESRSTTKQREYWAKIGCIAEENPDLSYDFIKSLLLAKEEVKQGLVTNYEFD